MTLSKWRDEGWLVEHRTSPEEIHDFLSVAERDLMDSAVPGFSADNQFAVACNAARQAAAAGLAASGYRAVGDRKHHWTIRSLVYTIDADPQLVRALTTFYRKCNVGKYERAGETSLTEAQEIRRLARGLFATVRHWIENTHPEFTTRF